VVVVVCNKYSKIVSQIFKSGLCYVDKIQVNMTSNAG
jgi:hypothetical protein